MGKNEGTPAMEERMHEVELRLDVTEVDVAIIGGGLAGLALGLGLQERGIDAHVFEKGNQLRTDSATAISMALNGMRAVDGIKPGLAGQMRDLGLEARVYTIIRTPGKPDIRIPVQHRKGEFFMVGWRFSQELLASMVDKSRIHCNHRFVNYGLAQDGVGVNAKFLIGVPEDVQQRVFKTVRAKMVVGADGLWSNMRKCMIGDVPRYLNFVNWNALIYNPECKVFKYSVGEVHMIHSGDERLLAYISDLGRGYVLWLLRVLDEDGTLAESYLERFAENDKELSKTLCLKQLEGLDGWDDVRGAIEATDPSLIYERRSMDRPPLTKWSDLDGRAVLIGDACHSMYTALGMGARTAFEDAHQLTLAVENIFRSPDREGEIPKTIQRFEEIRVPRILKIHEFALELSEQPQVVPEWVKKLSREERTARLTEFLDWTCQYPHNPHGNPNSLYWKPGQHQHQSTATAIAPATSSS